MSRVDFFVPGCPVAKGSLRAFTRKGGGVGVEEGNVDKVRPWMSAISLAARDAGATPGDGAVRVGLMFVFPRPKGHFTSAGALRPKAPKFHAKKPDVDKLVRAVLDALTGVAFTDDARVAGLDPAPWKRYAGLGEPTGARVIVQSLEEASA